MTLQHTEKPKNDKGTCKNTEANRDSTNADTYWILSIDVKSLGWPEQQDGEKVGPGDEGDDQSQDEDSRTLLKAGRKHGEFGKFPLPNKEGDG